MNSTNETDINKEDVITDEAYLMTMITCSVCQSDLMASDLEFEEANDPMDIWAEKFNIKARNIGWSVSSYAAIVCPNCNE